MRLALVCVTLAISVGGCAHKDHGLMPPTATLPLRHAGINDVRHSFHKVLADELRSEELADALLHMDGVVCRGSNSTCDNSRAVGTQLQPTSFARTAVVLVPGIFYDCIGAPFIPFLSLANAAQPEGVEAALGQLKESAKLASVTFTPIGGRMASADNAAVISQHLTSIAQDPHITSIFIFAYSKGVADSMQALVSLNSAGKLSPKVKAFVSLAGAVMGSDRADSGTSLYRLISPGLQASTCKPSSSGQEVTDLSRGVRQSWLASNTLPASVQMFSVAAYTSRDRTHPLLRGSFDAITPLDPRNDGQVAASLAMLPSSSLVAHVNSDHWRFVLALEEHPSWLVRRYFSEYEFPREAFFRALVRFVQAEER